MFLRLLRGVAAVPARCAICAAWPSRPVCESCVARFAQPVPRCGRCAIPVPAGASACGRCAAGPDALDACHAAVSYEYPWQSLISRFKFQGAAGWAGTFATLMRSAPWMEDAIDAADLVVPMPLSRQRLAERGYNQAQLLARRLGAGKSSASLLLRVRDTGAQSALDLAARATNVAGAFAVDPLRAAEVKGRRIAIVDDVMTSGASLRAAARALRHAGAGSVCGLVFARTDQPA